MFSGGKCIRVEFFTFVKRTSGVCSKVKVCQVITGLCSCVLVCVYVGGIIIRVFYILEKLLEQWHPMDSTHSCVIGASSTKCKTFPGKYNGSATSEHSFWKEIFRQFSTFYSFNTIILLKRRNNELENSTEFCRNCK